MKSFDAFCGLFLALWAFAPETVSAFNNYDRAKALASQYVENPQEAVVREGVAVVSSDTSYYIFNDSRADKGFVIIGNVSDMTRVVGYSDTGAIDPRNMPDALKVWLQSLNVTNKPGGATDDILNASVVVPPLIKTKWYQLEPYNCKLKSQSYLTGCVATAMSQIMNYHQWPERGHGQVKYNSFTPVMGATSAGAGVMEADLSTSVYDWNNMRDIYADENWSEAEADAVGTLMRDCGYAVWMQYSLMFSGAYDQDAAAALIENFGYDAEVYPNFGDMTRQQWLEKIKSELDAGFPVIMTGQGSPLGGDGHCFIADGYDSNDFIHINWGWNGEADGFYDMTVLTPEHNGQNNYSFMQYFTTAHPRKPYSEACFNPAMIMLYDLANKNFDHAGLTAENAGTELSADNPAKIRVDGLCYVSAKSYEGEFMLWLVDDNGNKVCELFAADVSHPELDTGIGQNIDIKYAEIPAEKFGTLPDGNYKIVAFGRYRDMAPLKIQAYGYKSHVNVSVVDGRVTLSNVHERKAVFSLAAPAYDLPGEVPLYASYSFAAELTNVGDFVGGGTIDVRAYAPNGKSFNMLFSKKFALYPGDKIEIPINFGFSRIADGIRFSEGSEWRIEIVAVDNDGHEIDFVNPVASKMIKMVTDESYAPEFEITSLRIKEEDGGYIDMDDVVMDVQKNYIVEFESRTWGPGALPYGFDLTLDMADGLLSSGSRVGADGKGSLEALLYWSTLTVGNTYMTINRPDFLYDGRSVLCRPESLGKMKVRIIDSSAGIDQFGPAIGKTEVSRYNMQGIRVAKPVPGINIIVYSDGSVEKRVVDM